MTYANNSSQPGYLGPSATPYSPIEDAALDNFVLALVAGITNIPPAYVRPNWQATTPIQPPITTDWVAVGITEQTADNFAYTTRDTTTGGIATIKQEILAMTCDFYGPNVRGNASILRDGLSVKQNQETLLLNGWGFINCSPIQNLTQIINEQYYPRRNIVVYFRRVVAREYQVLDILSSSGTVNSAVDTATYQTGTVSP